MGRRVAGRPVPNPESLKMCRPINLVLADCDSVPALNHAKGLDYYPALGPLQI